MGQLITLKEEMKYYVARIFEFLVKETERGNFLGHTVYRNSVYEDFDRI
jgi:hypothetical protein